MPLGRSVVRDLFICAFTPSSVCLFIQQAFSEYCLGFVILVTQDELGSVLPSQPLLAE